MTAKLFNIFAYEHGKFMGSLPSADIFFQKQVVNLEIYIECTGQESYLRVHICSMLTERVRELNFFFGIVLSLARSMERKVFFRQFCVTGIFINFYSSRIFQIFREFLRDYVYVYIYICVCVCLKRLDYFTLL